MAASKYFIVVNRDEGYEPEDQEPVQGATVAKAVEAHRNIYGTQEDCEYDVYELGAPVRVKARTVRTTKVERVK